MLYSLVTCWSSAKVSRRDVSSKDAVFARFVALSALDPLLFQCNRVKQKTNSPGPGAPSPGPRPRALGGRDGPGARAGALGTGFRARGPVTPSGGKEGAFREKSALGPARAGLDLPGESAAFLSLWVVVFVSNRSILYLRRGTLALLCCTSFFSEGSSSAFLASKRSSRLLLFCSLFQARRARLLRGECRVGFTFGAICESTEML